MVERGGQELDDVRSTDIVVGVDGSEPAKAALRWALTQARYTGGRIQAIAAWEFPTYSGWSPTFPYEDLAANAGKVLSESVHEALGVGAPRWRCARAY